MANSMTFDCPVCFEEMKPPMKIFQCIEGHPICELCKNMVNICPTCRADMGPGRVSRNRLAESILRDRAEEEGSNGDYHQASAPPWEDTEVGSSITSQGEEEISSVLKTHFFTEDDEELDTRDDLSNDEMILISTPDASQYGVFAAECLGHYKLAGNHDGTVYYKQMDTVNFRNNYCYRQSGKWWAGHRLGAEYGWLCCENGAPYPPARGWRYNDIYFSWRDAPLLSVQDGLSLCQRATVLVSGNPQVEVVRDISGEYFLFPDQFCGGRVILKHFSKDRFLMFWCGSWEVMNKIPVDGGIANPIASNPEGKMTLCPGHEKSKEWITWINEDEKSGCLITVRITCHTHKKQSYQTND